MRWLKLWRQRGGVPDPAAALQESEQRLAEAEELVQQAQPTIAAVKRARQRNRLSESVAAALEIYGSRA